MSNPDRNARSARLHYGLIIGCGLAVEIMQALFLVQAFGFYAVEWVREFGWSNGAIAVAFSVFRGGTGVLAPIQGAFLDRIGARKLMLAGILVLGCGYAALSQVGSLWTLYAVFCLFAVGSSLCGPTTITTVLINWFERKQASAIAITQLGFGLSGLAVPLMALSMSSLGWRVTAFASGLAILAIGLPICWVMRNRPEELGLRPYGSDLQQSDAAPPAASNADPISSPERKWSVADVLRMPSFWFLSAGHGVALIYISAITVQLVPYMTGELHFDEQRAAWIVLSISVFMMLGQLTMTFGESLFPKKTTVVVAVIIQAAALVLLARASSYWDVVIFSAVHGFVWGLRGPLQHTLRAEYFGRALFARLSGIALTIAMVGMVIGPVFGGVLADLLGSNRQGFLALAGVALVSAAMFAYAKRP